MCSGTLLGMNRRLFFGLFASMVGWFGRDGIRKPKPDYNQIFGTPLDRSMYVNDWRDKISSLQDSGSISFDLEWQEPKA